MTHYRLRALSGAFTVTVTVLVGLARMGYPVTL